MFPCLKCGACCRHLQLNQVYAALDRGDGVCRYLEDDLCSIYEQRPLFCRVDECYDLYFASLMSRDEFYRANSRICQALREQQT